MLALGVLLVLKNLAGKYEFGPVSQWVSQLGDGAGTWLPSLPLQSLGFSECLSRLLPGSAHLTTVLSGGCGKEAGVFLFSTQLLTEPGFQ